MERQTERSGRQAAIVCAAAEHAAGYALQETNRRHAGLNVHLDAGRRDIEDTNQRARI